MSEQMKNVSPMDAFAEITIDADCKAAYLIIHGPKYGGKFITPEQIEKTISESDIAFGLEDMSRITKAVKTLGSECRFRIASWKQPVDGENGYIEYKFNPNKVARPTENEHGDVDYKNLGIVTNITRGTKIARIYDPTDGEPGTDVLGNIIPPKPGTPAAITLGSGTELSAGGHHILASTDGNLVFKGGCFIVEEELMISGDVGLSTGNIDFIGNVVISGSVFEGFRVYSKKNVTIRGAATTAEIKAGGSVSIRLGCLMSRVTCNGNFKADFCETSRIEANGDVEANSFVGCEVFARGRIIANGKGIISGGRYTALEDISASVIGSNSYVKTEITIGNNAVLTAEREKTTARVAKLEEAVEQLSKVIDQLTERQKQGVKLSARHERMKAESLRTKILTQAEIKKARDRIEEIDEDSAHKQNFSVFCKKRFYPGTTIRIDAYTYSVTTVCENCKATIRDDKIVMLPP